MNKSANVDRLPVDEIKKEVCEPKRIPVVYYAARSKAMNVWDRDSSLVLNVPVSAVSSSSLQTVLSLGAYCIVATSLCSLAQTSWIAGAIGILTTHRVPSEGNSTK